MELNSNQIQEINPHRYPFALVDRITDYKPGEYAKGIKCVSVNEMHFCGHFPQHHVMPGVLIVESLAQTGAVAILSMEQNRFDKKIAEGKYYPQLDINAAKYWYLTGANTSLVNFGLQSQVRVDATWNLFNSYAAFFTIQSARANTLALNAQILDLRKDIATELSNLLNSLNVAKEQLNLAKVALTQAEENYRIVSNRYQQNIANYIELLNAELLLTNAKSSLVTARYEIAMNIARIEHLQNHQF